MVAWEQCLANHRDGQKPDSLSARRLLRPIMYCSRMYSMSRWIENYLRGTIVKEKEGIST